jgi:hypothetical protein
MFNRGFFIVTALIFLISTVGITFAMEKGNDRKGKYTYRKVYKACQKSGGVETDKPTVSPDAKTKAQWQRLFDDKGFDELGCRPQWDQLDAGDLLDILAYLQAHAADSDAPAKCQ